MQEKFFLGRKWRKMCEKYAFLSISLQPVHISDFWYKTSLLYYFEYGIGNSARKEKIGPKMVKKGVKNMHFQAFLDNQPLDLSGFGMRLA